jgi:predicted alpha-1,6-mannanase (GH76 family)
MKKPPKSNVNLPVRCFRIFVLLLFFVSTSLSRGQVLNQRADSSIQAFNNAFLVTQGDKVYYKKALNDNSPDGNWTLALDIFGMQDTYERRKSDADKALVNNLCNSFLKLNPPPYAWDGWNDDIAWMGLGLARGYQVTGTPIFLTQAEYCFNLAYDRGWNTVFNGGGIWEQQPDMTPAERGKTPAEWAISKEALANNPNGKLACILYESTGKAYYRDKAIQIYNWSRSHLFNPLNGQVYVGIDRVEVLNKGTAVYNQGSFIDFAAHLYKITGNELMLRDAQLAVNYVINNMTTNGIISNSADYLNTWADEYARGLGHLCMWNPQLWNTYYPFMKRNADAAWKNRRTDLNLSWNGWAVPTPVASNSWPTKYISAVAMLQFTPTVHSLSGTIEAEDFNFMQGVSTKSLSTGGRAVGAIDSGDWLEFIVNAPIAALYTLSFSVAGTAAGSMEIQQNNVTLATLALPATSGTFSAVNATVKLKAGIQSLKLKAVAGGWTIDKFTAQSCSQIVPIVLVNGKAAQQTASVTVASGDKVQLKPTPGDGTWSWTGPQNFSSTSRVVTLNKIGFSQGGIYTARYTNPAGCVSEQDFVITLKNCTPTPISTSIQVNEAAPQQVDSLIVQAGSYVAVGAQPAEGSWTWTGPNGFTSNERELSFLSIDYPKAGKYTVTHTNPAGCVSTRTISIALTGPDPCGSPITPYLNVNDVSWKKQEYASLNTGDKITVGPQAADGGTWSWNGPNNFTATTREFTITNFTAQQAGTYTATFTSASGCKSLRNFTIGFTGNCTQTPITPTITVNGTQVQNTASISVHSGDSVLIKFPATAGTWRWTGPNGFTAEAAEIYFKRILFWQKGSYEISLISNNACISTHMLTIDVTNDDYCGTPITPYFNVNDGTWQSDSSVTVNEGDKLQLGPQPGKNMWAWTGPGGFFANTREIVLRNIQVNQAGTYQATYTNNLGCLSFKNIVVTVNKVNVLTAAASESQILSFYPNPATDEVTLTNIAENELIVVSDLYGKVMLQPIPTTADGKTKINISALKPGLYFINVGDHSNRRNYKLIKK